MARWKNLPVFLKVTLFLELLFKESQVEYWLWTELFHLKFMH